MVEFIFCKHVLKVNLLGFEDVDVRCKHVRGMETKMTSK